MSFNQPLWFFEEADKARAALGRLGPTPQARAGKAPTPREQFYLAAVEALFRPGAKPARDKAYTDAMAALATRFPEDDEAQVFYALSLLALLPKGDQALPLREKAGGILERLFTRNPQHPGAAHYLLHAYDHGALAPRALSAARAYAKIAAPGRATRCICPRIRLSNWACGTRPLPPIRPRGTRRSSGPRGEPCLRRRATITA